SSGAARHPHLRGGRPFSCCAGEGLDQMVSQIGVQPSLLPFTGEGARRADEGARAQRSVLLTFASGARNATAARCARALIRRSPAPSPAAQEKGWTGRRRKLGGSPLPLRRRRAGPGGAANWGGSPSPAAQERGWGERTRGRLEPL